MRISIVLIIGLTFSGCARQWSEADNQLASSITACQNRMSQEATAKYNRLTEKSDILLMSAIDGLVRGQSGYVDPCAQIKTHVHAEIAYTKQQEAIWGGFWSTAKVGLIGTFSYLSLDSMFDTVAVSAAAAGSSFNFQSEGGDISLSDSLNSYEFGGFGDIGNLTDSPITFLGDNISTTTETTEIPFE